MGFLAIDFAIHGPKKPKTLVVTGRTQKKIDMAARLYTVEEAKKNGVDLVYLHNIKKTNIVLSSLFRCVVFFMYISYHI